MTAISSAAAIWKLLQARYQATPDAMFALDRGGRNMTVGALFRQVERTAAGLHAAGFRAGEVVSWQLPTRFETVVLTLALARIGAVQNPLVTMLREDDVAFICGQAGSRHLFVPRTYRGTDHEQLAAAVVARIPGLAAHVIDDGLPAGDPADLPPASPEPTVRWLLYTSGTTSSPKGARHTDRAILAAADTFGSALRIESTDRIAALAPIGHIAGIAHICNALRRGATLVLDEIFDPVRTTQFLSTADVTVVGSGVPFIRAYLQQQRLHPQVRLFPMARAFLCGGSPRPEALHQQVKQELGGIGVVSGYGLTECPHISWGHADDSDHQHATTEGPPGPGGEIRIARTDGSAAAIGEIGEIRVRGPQLMVGYVDAGLDVDAFDDDGFFRTGDLGFLDDAGYLTVTGRLKDVIIRNMENISAREVEGHLLGHPAVAEVAVVGLPSQTTGELACAVVVTAAGAPAPSLADLSAHLTRSGLNIRKHPEQLEVVAELPKNAMGKVIKQELRDRFASC
ncbi:MAG TPA: AMP-binding protein [Mycobacteriales bacterium]|jgi:acyl-CoA synthetase (AMP-forming)/AMP-acid ligase II|nr:AMP-binding protein [Mycobacteriales bacterium]